MKNTTFNPDIVYTERKQMTTQVDLSTAIKVELMSGGKMPTQATEQDAGFDIHARLVTEIVIQPGGRQLIPGGFSLELPEGWKANIRSRSGLALKHGVVVLNSPGLIDTNYRDEVGVLLINTDRHRVFIVNPGDRIAQIEFVKMDDVKLTEGKVSREVDRGGGFGSTGVKALGSKLSAKEFNLNENLYVTSDKVN